MNSPASAPAHAGDAAQPFVSVEGLYKSFKIDHSEVSVLKGIDVSFRSGEMISIVGASGAGKSTLLHIIGTIDQPTKGSVRFDGADVFSRSRSDLAIFRNHTIGFVFQFHHLLPEFTALENVMMPGLIQRLSRNESEERARELLEVVGLSERLKHKPGELSGGEQQRVALARALVLRPRLILADEPTGNLDSKTSEGIHELFLSLNERYGITMVVVTHNVALAHRMPRRLRMTDGVLEEES